MCSWPSAAVLCCALFAQAAPAASYPGIGRAATPAEVAAWDIDVRPDFKGLPAGSGSVAQGQSVWEAKCADCHGVFGESGAVFAPIVGGTTAGDIETGRVARLADRAYPERTALMKLATISTLWDYIRRAMPWNAPKSLSTDQVYAATAYVLNLGGIVPDDFVLSDKTIAEAQRRLPNRNGMTTEHALWPGPEFGRRPPDVQGSACLRECEAREPRIVSRLPASARTAHGNLALQSRLVGAQLGADTSRPDAGSVEANAAAARAQLAAAAATSLGPAVAPARLAEERGCLACHAIDRKVVGPAFAEVAKKYAGRAEAASYLARRIRSGSSGVWGAAAMPPQSLPEEDARSIAQWIAEGARKP